MRQSEADVGSEGCPTKGQGLSWWEKSQRRCGCHEAPGPGLVPHRWQWEAASWVCRSSSHTETTQSRWSGQALNLGNSCLHQATWLTAATQTCRPFPGCQAELEKSLSGLGGLQPERTLGLAQCPAPP